jgi:ABC-type uncharacterized transport system permease subunit
MAVIEINKNPSRRELLVFGGLLALFVAFVGLMFRFKFGAPAGARVVWIAGAALVALYFAVPPLRRPLYVGWLYAAYPIGFVVSHVILAAIYYLVFTPVGLLLRALGKDPMQRAFDRQAKSYWVEHDPHTDTRRYLRQF